MHLTDAVVEGTGVRLVLLVLVRGFFGQDFLCLCLCLEVSRRRDFLIDGSVIRCSKQISIGSVAGLGRGLALGLSGSVADGVGVGLVPARVLLLEVRRGDVFGH